MVVSNKQIGEFSLVMNRLKNNYGGLAQMIMIIYLFADSLAKNYNLNLFFLILMKRIDFHPSLSYLIYYDVAAFSSFFSIKNIKPPAIKDVKTSNP